MRGDRTTLVVRPGHPVDTVVLTGCAIVWIWAAIDPIDAGTWRLEQIASVVGVGVFAWASHPIALSSWAKMSLGVLFCVHTVGTHYTYSLVPYDQLADWLFGVSVTDVLDLERNHYDRFVHFAFGLFSLPAITEAITHKLGVSRAANSFIGFNLVLSVSAAYEVLEWGAAVIFAGGATAYVGAQGDPWDAQVDIALGGAGFLVAWACLSVGRMVGR
mgnify:CR=1 FL=1